MSLMRKEIAYRRQVNQKEDTFAAAKVPSTNDDSFHSAIGPILVVAQCFSIMPITGILSPTPDKLKFKWRSPRTLVTLFYIIAGTWVLSTAFQHQLRRGITPRTVVNLIFLSCAITSSVLFFVLARKWPTVANTWQSYESVFLRPPYTIHKRSLKQWIRGIGGSILGAATVEHIFFSISYYHNAYKKITLCGHPTSNLLEYFVVTEYGYLLQQLPYNYFTAAMIWFVNIMFTFCWNFMDIFIILVSVGISTRFHQINQRITNSVDEHSNELFWNEIRNDYISVCELLKFIDQTISIIVVLSCVNDVYFICFQLLNIYSKLPYLINYIYFWYSLLYLIVRMVLTFFVASEIDEASKQPMDIIRKLPTSVWNVELDRFVGQLRFETNALSAKNFFHITRSVILGLAGTIVTYELVMLQFDTNVEQKERINICD